MEETKTKIQGTLVQPEIVATFNDEALIEIMMNLKGAIPAEVVQVTLPGSNVRKTNNPFYNKADKEWLVEKVAKINGMFGTDYEKGVQKASGDAEFEAQEHKWAAHWKNSPIVMVNKKEIDSLLPEKFYLAIRPLRADEVSYRFRDTKSELTDEQVRELKSFETPRDSGPIVWRTVAVSNIQEIKMNKVRYQRIS